jgi:hypothetical protein
LTDELSIAFVSRGAAAGTGYTNYGINNNGDSPCALPGPPALRFEDLAGADLAIEYRNNVSCPNVGYPYCVLHGSLALPPSPETPALRGPTSAATLMVAVAGTGYFSPCEFPNVIADTLVFTFPEVGELQVGLDGLELQQCETQVTLYSFE